MEELMGEIRSALDIALEKTKDISVSRESLNAQELKTEGKKAATSWLAGGDKNALRVLLNNRTDADKNLLVEGFVSIVLAATHIPAPGESTEKIHSIGEALEMLLPGEEMGILFSRLARILDQYTAEKEQMEQALRQQFLPRLRAKQQELAKRYGQTVNLEPEQDSEYMNLLNRNRSAIEAKYESIIVEVRERFRMAAGLSQQ